LMRCVLMMGIYKRLKGKDILISKFIRIMQLIALLEIDEESQAYAISNSMLSYASHLLHHNLWDIEIESEIPGIIQDILENLLNVVKSRPQIAWYHLMLMETSMEQGQRDSAESHAKEAISIIEELGYFDSLSVYFSCYLLMGDIDKADELAAQWLKSRPSAIFARWEKVFGTYKLCGYIEYIQASAKQVKNTVKEIFEKKGVTCIFPEQIELGKIGLIQFVDQFDGNLDNDWRWMGPKEVFTYELKEGYLQINVQPSKKAFLQRAISGDFVIETKVSNGSDGDMFGGLHLGKDDGNRVVFSAISSAVHYIKGSVQYECFVDSNPIGYGYWLCESENVWLRLEKRGTKVSAYFSEDGINWQTFGGLDFDWDDPLQVGIQASNYETPPSSTRFDYFKIYR
ncbi:MAG: hypothetical protein AAB116_27290, partial [Candidatus Poribacteria bacterium]